MGLRKAGGHGFRKLLLNSMVENEKKASGFATIGLEGHWSHGSGRSIWSDLASNQLIPSELGTQ